MRTLSAVFFTSMLATTEAHASGGPAFMGLILVVVGLGIAVGLVVLVAGAASFATPKQKRAKVFLNTLIASFAVAIILSTIDFLFVLVFYSSGDSRILIHE